MQAFLLCSLDYDFHVLNNAFLIHKPGIKRGPKANVNKKKELQQANLISYQIMPHLRRIMGEKREGKCTL